MPKAIPLLLLAALMLTACASGLPPTQTPILSPPQREMQSCPALPPLASAEMTDLLINHLEVAKAYHQCRDLHQGLINWLEATDAVR